MDFSSVVAKVSPSIAKIFVLNREGQVAGTGSGFLYQKKGILLTCDHVVTGGATVLCKFTDDDKYIPAKVALQDTEHDLAILKLDTDREPLVKAPTSKPVMAGMPVLFSGYPLSLEALTTHQGILSAITEDQIGVTTYLIDGTVNSGNSGCPLMNADGEIIGVVNAKRRERSDLLSKVESMAMGAVSLHGIDLVEIYQALISNVQLGIGYAVPASYIPEHKEGTRGGRKAGGSKAATVSRRTKA
ncbi:serine protease [Phenylobacterium sp.]|jgi:S1-C subfamily serine protease|uniref:S1C family serine protease n=1 Tax=Phenylobacterium sp. TaxID=1871053 RepID=UPI002E2FB74D|nr:serine protease [Phenylobacterium sp.]HEX3365777.1 serine protease [Phenylobacterium sp.]